MFAFIRTRSPLAPVNSQVTSSTEAERTLNRSFSVLKSDSRIFISCLRACRHAICFMVTHKFVNNMWFSVRCLFFSFFMGKYSQCYDIPPLWNFISCAHAPQHSTSPKVGTHRWNDDLGKCSKCKLCVAHIRLLSVSLFVHLSFRHTLICWRYTCLLEYPYWPWLV